jgi:hypothetical protein
MPVMVYQEKNAFAKVPAVSMRKRFREKVPRNLQQVCLRSKASQPAPEEEESDEEDDDGEGKEDADAEAMALMLVGDPDLDPSELLRRVKGRYEVPGEDTLDLQDAIDSDVAQYLLLRDEFVAMRSWVQNMEKRKTRLRGEKFKVREKVEHFIPLAYASLNKPVPKAKALAKALALGDREFTFQRIKRDAAWRAKTKAKDPSLMQMLLPPFSTAREDTEMGCWRVTYKEKRLPQAAWSYYERGDGAAMKGALRVLWEAYTAEYDRPCPYEEEISWIPDD